MDSYKLRINSIEKLQIFLKKKYGLEYGDLISNDIYDFIYQEIKSEIETEVYNDAYIKLKKSLEEIFIQSS